MDVRAQLWRFTGSGWRLEHPELPADEVTWVDALQSAPTLTLRLDNERPAMPSIIPWLHAIAVEVAGTLQAFAVVTDRDSADQALTVNAVGLTGYLKGMPWTRGPVRRYEQDPAGLIRLIWRDVQNEPGGNIGVVVDGTSTSVRVGKRVTEVVDQAGTVVTPEQDDPFILDRTETHDLASEVDRLMTEGGLEWREQVSWDADHRPVVRLRMAPRLGRRRLDVRCVVGVNLDEVPAVEEEPDDYASHVLLIGAGEGPTRIVATASLPRLERIRRVHVEQAQDLYRQQAADAEASRVLSFLQPQQGRVKTLSVRDHPSCPVWELAPGDELQLVGDLGQAKQAARWVRIVAIESSATTPHVRSLEVETL